MSAIHGGFFRTLVMMAALTGGAMLAAVNPAHAFTTDDSGPQACAPHAHRFDVPGLWLGHFSGGRAAWLASGDRSVDWRSEYQCFFSARACQTWRAGLKRHYARYDGWGSCLPLRGGGVAIRKINRGISARY